MFDGHLEDYSGILGHDVHGWDDFGRVFDGLTDI